MTTKFYKNLFNPNIHINPNYNIREYELRYTVQTYLKDVIKSCHEHNNYCAQTDLYEVKGALRFMRNTGILDSMQYEFLNGITKQIVKKYHLY